MGMYGHGGYGYGLGGFGPSGFGPGGFGSETEECVELWTHENGRRYGHMMNQRGGWGGGYHRSPGELYREYMARQGGYDGPGGQGKERGMGGYRPEKMGQGYGDSRCCFKLGSYPGFGAYGPGRPKNMN